MSLDPYEILGIRRSATAEEIQRAYHRLARELHPDTNSDPDATGRFQRVQEAASILRDPVKRREFDSHSRSTQQNSQGQPGPYSAPPGEAAYRQESVQPTVYPALIDLGTVKPGFVTQIAVELTTRSIPRHGALVSYLVHSDGNWLNVADTTTLSALPIRLAVIVDARGLRGNASYLGEIVFAVDGETTKTPVMMRLAPVNTASAWAWGLTAFLIMVFITSVGLMNSSAVSDAPSSNALDYPPQLRTFTPSQPAVSRAAELQASPAEVKIPEVSLGQYCSISGTSQVGVLFGGTTEALRQAEQALSTNDNQGKLRNLLQSGLVLIVKPATRGLVVAAADGLSQIRILEGDYVTRLGWVSEEFVHPGTAPQPPVPTTANLPTSAVADIEEESKSGTERPAEPSVHSPPVEPPKPPPAPRAPDPYAPATRVFLSYGNWHGIVLSRDFETVEEIYSKFEKSGPMGTKPYCEDDRAFTVNLDTSAEITAHRQTFVQVRILEGGRKDAQGWVPVSWIRKS